MCMYIAAGLAYDIVYLPLSEFSEEINLNPKIDNLNKNNSLIDSNKINLKFRSIF